MSETAQRFPLSWPTGWKRTPYGQRRHAAFHATRSSTNGGGALYKRKVALDVGDGLERLTGELRRLGARNVIISSNLVARNDGLPYAQQRKNIDDPGVAVYFVLNGQRRVLASDRWLSAAENMAAIAGHINAIRAVDRYGVGTLDQAFAGYAALPANTAANWRDVFGFADGSRPSVDQVDEKFKALAREAHPDAGGGHEQMARLSEARAFARKELSS